MRKLKICSLIFVCSFSLVLLSAFSAFSGIVYQSKTPIKNQGDQKNIVKKDSRRVYRQQEIIVKFKQGTGEEDIQKLNNKYGASVLSKYSKMNTRRMRTPADYSINEMLSLYGSNENVEYVEPNYVVYAKMMPNDTYYSFQWHLDNPQSGGINAEGAWDVETGNSDVIVAVLDTGVAYENYGIYKQASDLENTSFVQGYDVINQDTHPNDDNGHGTHITGTIAQSTNNFSGVAGIAFNVSIMPVKVLDADGEGSHAAVAEGIYYAVDNGAKIINMSLGSTEESNTLREALAYAYGKGVTIVAAAGNDGTETANYPAAYDEYVISVGATRFDETRAYYSNYGTSLDIMAPGGDLSVDQNNDGYPDGILQQTFSGRQMQFGYWFYEGTSMATSHITGVAALILSHNEFVPSQVREALEMTARHKGEAGWDSEYGWGIVDAAAAVEYMPMNVHEIIITDVSVAATALIGDVVPIDVTIKNAGNYEEEITVKLMDGITQTSIDSQALELAPYTSSTVCFNWTTSGLPANDYPFSVSISGNYQDADADNNEASFSIKLIEPKHDLQVSSFNVPLEISQGTWVTLPATIDNTGTYEEEVIFSLNDTTSGKTIASKFFSLKAGETSTVSCTWNTAPESLGEHRLQAYIQPVDGESAVSDNILEQTTNITDSQSSETTDVELLDVRASSNRMQYYILAYIQNTGSSSQTITATCTVFTQDGTSITDSGLADKNIMLPAGYRAKISWYGSSRLRPGRYSATVHIEGAAEEKSCIFYVR